jgi:4,5-dihydroxyphthalate decarboxylase
MGARFDSGSHAALAIVPDASRTVFGAIAHALQTRKQPMNEPSIRRLHTLLGDYPNTLPLKRGVVRSSSIALDFADVKAPHTAFKRVVRDLEFDVAELALVTFLIAKAHGKPLSLLPVIMFSRSQHPYLVYNAERGCVRPGDLAGRRIGIRAYSVTTVAWIRGILLDDYALDPDSVRWVTFEEPHVAEFRDPPNAQRAPAGKDLTSMLLDGEIDAAVLGAIPDDPRLKPVIEDPAAAAKAWQAKNRALQINHMVVVKESLSQSDPAAVREVYRLLAESKRAGGLPLPSEPDPIPLGVAANRRNLDIAIEYAFRQRLIDRRFAVDELFDDLTRTFET